MGAADFKRTKDQTQACNHICASVPIIPSCRDKYFEEISRAVVALDRAESEELDRIWERAVAG